MSVSQHFLLSSAARTLSLARVMRMSDQKAFEQFKAIRWAATHGDPVCPRCGCIAHYELAERKLWKCKGCSHQFSVTSSTIFAGHKLSLRTILSAIAVFVDQAKGHSALALGRDLDVSYKTAFVLAHKLREVLAAEIKGVHGNVEVDGAYFGGYVKPTNHKANRRDLRLPENQTGKRQAIVVMRERDGRTLPFVAKNEVDGVEIIKKRVEPGSTIYADEAACYNKLRSSFLTKRINHEEAYSSDDACTNLAESFFSRVRRAEIGVHHHIAGPYLQSYADEMAWREDNRRISNGDLYLDLIGLGLSHPVSRVWKGYWQRWQEGKA